MQVQCIVSSVDALKRKVAAFKELYSTPVVKVSGVFEYSNGDAAWMNDGRYHVVDIGNRYITVNDVNGGKHMRVRFPDDPGTQVQVFLT